MENKITPAQALLILAECAALANLPFAQHKRNEEIVKNLLELFNPKENVDSIPSPLSSVSANEPIPESEG